MESGKIYKKWEQLANCQIHIKLLMSKIIQNIFFKYLIKNHF